MTLQDIINENWGEDDGVVSYVRVEGTHYYKVIRGGGGGGYTPECYFDSHDPFENSDEEDDGTVVIKIAPKRDEEEPKGYEQLDDTPTAEHSNESTGKKRGSPDERPRVQLPYKPIVTPAGRCARNEGYLWRQKDDGSYDKRPCKRTEYFNDYYHKVGVTRVKCEFCGRDTTKNNLSAHHKAKGCRKNQPNN